MNSILRNTLYLLKVFCHLTIIGMASLFITSLALNSAPTDGIKLFQYLFNIMILLVNFCPSGNDFNDFFYYHVVWLFFNLAVVIVVHLTNGNCRGLVDIDVILGYPESEEREVRTRVLFYASLASWLIVLIAFVTSLSISMGLAVIPKKKKVSKTMDKGNISKMTNISLESDIKVTSAGSDKKDAEKDNIILLSLMKKIVHALKNALRQNVPEPETAPIV